MSWDLYVFEFEEALSDPKDGTAVFGDNWEPPEIGDSQYIRSKVTDALPETNWSDPVWGTLDGSDFSLEFNLGICEVISVFAIHARGRATQPVLSLMASTGWRILDTSTGKWMHEMSSPDEGRMRFLTYLNKIVETARQRKKRGMFNL